MKRVLLLAMIIGFSASLLAQEFAPPEKELRNIAIPDLRAMDDLPNLEKGVNPYVKSGVTPSETDVGETIYDLQSNACTQNRFVMHADGTMGATWTYGMEDGSGFADRGTGYNFYDGSEWGPYPNKRIESDRTGWPSYDAWGENGEITCAHISGGEEVGLLLNMREQKGTGEWTEVLLQGPEGHEGVLWPRMVTSGPNNETIHVIYLTRPVANGGAIYEGQDGALLYARSSDGGQTWDIKDEIINGLGEDYYTAFSGDGYCWIDPQGDNLAFLVGDNWVDFVLMTSDDGGDTWEKTVIWEHPYPMFDPNNPTETDTFYCVDGAFHGAFDNNGKIHVTFGINRAMSDGSALSWFPFVEGLGYWNEDRETFSDNVDALSPYIGSDPDSELEDLYSLIAWVPDLNGNGTWTQDLVQPGAIESIGLYYLSPSSMPQMTIDANNDIYISFSAICEERGTQSQNYRQLFATRGTDDGMTWLEEFVWLTESPVHTFDECVFASHAPMMNDNFHLLYQRDEEPGLAIRGDEDPFTNNTLTYMSVPKSDVQGVEEINPATSFKVYQNYPNPFNATSTIEVSLKQSADVEVSIYNNMGQLVSQIDKGELRSGLHKIQVSASDLSAGSYFYTVKVDDSQVTKQMIVR
ncbi:MAG: T9SS type A sorting domain-containing protein [Bacteroidales bacterium]|nr:T9SS type A sorting domain-containing protein [Bacteroidales bacterium]